MTESTVETPCYPNLHFCDDHQAFTDDLMLQMDVWSKDPNLFGTITGQEPNTR